MRVVKNILPAFLLMHSVATHTTTAVLLHTTEPAGREPAGLIMIVIFARTKSVKTFELWQKLSTMWCFAHSQECSCSWSQDVTPLAQQDHSVCFSASKEDKFIHISPFLVFQISSDPYWQTLRCNKGIVFPASWSLLRIFGAFASQFLPSHSGPSCRPLINLPFWIAPAEVTACPVVTGTLWPKRWYFASQAMTVWISVMADLCTQGTECRAAVAHSRWYFQTLGDGSLIFLALRTARVAFLSPG